LNYSFCLQASAACQEGAGSILSSAFTGSIPTGLNKSAVLNLLVDTSNTGLNFNNWTCFNYDPEIGTCDGGIAPAVGGLISLSFTKTRDWATVNTSTYKLYRVGILTQTNVDAQYNFAAHLQGTVLGLTVNVVGIDPDGNWMSTGTDSVTLKRKFQAAKHQN
jgi:hypothetical protein